MVYVDNYEGRFGRMIMCHMMADSLEELHEFAAKLNLKPSWFQKGSAPHYDLSKTKRSEALLLGAIELPIHIDGKPNPKWKEVYNKAKTQKVFMKIKSVVVGETDVIIIYGDLEIKLPIHESVRIKRFDKKYKVMEEWQSLAKNLEVDDEIVDFNKFKMPSPKI